MRAPAVFTIPKRSVYIKSHFWTDVNKTAAAFCFFLHFFVFAGSGIVVLLQATHNTLPARSTALHIGRRQPKALYACRFPPALRDQTRRWYRDAAGQPMRNVNGRFALHKGIEAAVNLVLRNRIQKPQIFIKKSSFLSFRAFILFMYQKCKGSHQKTKAVCNNQIAFYLQFTLGQVNIILIVFICIPPNFI